MCKSQNNYHTKHLINFFKVISILTRVDQITIPITAVKEVVMEWFNREKMSGSPGVTAPIKITLYACILGLGQGASDDYVIKMAPNKCYLRCFQKLPSSQKSIIWKTPNILLWNFFLSILSCHYCKKKLFCK